MQRPVAHVSAMEMCRRMSQKTFGYEYGLKTLCQDLIRVSEFALMKTEESTLQESMCETRDKHDEVLTSHWGSFLQILISEKYTDVLEI